MRLVNGVCAPARRHVQVVDQLLDMLTDLTRIGQAVFCARTALSVGVERTERLRTGLFVLQVPRKLTIPDRRGRMSRWPGFGALLASTIIRPSCSGWRMTSAGAVTRQHVEIVDVDVALAMRGPGFGRVDVAAEPVVGDGLAGGVENQPTQRYPWFALALTRQWRVPGTRRQKRHVDQGATVVAQLAMPVAVTDIGTRGIQMVGCDQCLLDDILDTLDIRRSLPVRWWLSTDHPAPTVVPPRFGRTHRWPRPHAESQTVSALSVEGAQRAIAAPHMARRTGKSGHGFEHDHLPALRLENTRYG